MVIRILHVISSLSAGGIESLLVSLYENINREHFQFDFAVFNPNNPIHKDHLEDLGAQVYFIADAGVKSTLISKILWRIKAVINFMLLIYKNKYDVVHCHNYNNYGLYILLATLRGIPVRIVHSHNAGSNRENNFIKKYRRIKNLLSFEYLITHKIGCSDAATKWLYGDKSLENGKAKTIYNGIDIDKFRNTNYDKEKLRKVYSIKQGINFINIGRFSDPKNQGFLIDIFCEIAKHKKDVYLNIVGFGPLKKKLIKQIDNLNLNDVIRLFEFDTNIPELLSVMDFFLLPSKWEGFPITAMEAQIENIPIFISDKVTREVDMGLAVYLPIDKGARYCADYILDAIENNTYPRVINFQRMKAFDIKNIVLQFEELYSYNKY